MKKLIVNADDFGLCSSVNKAIIECHIAGNINSTTIMANMSGTKEAIELSKKHPNLKIGLHFCLTEGKPISDVDSLTKHDGTFYSWSQLNKRLVTNKVKKDDIKKEFYAQYSYLVNEGVEITHFDSHQHIHMNNTLFKVCSEISNELKIPVRLVDPIINWKLLFQRPKKGIKQFLLKYLSNKHRKLLESSTNNALIAVHDLNKTNNIDNFSYQLVLSKCKSLDIVELMVHPYILGEDIKTMYKDNWDEKSSFLSISSSEYNVLKEKDFIYSLAGTLPTSYEK